MIPWPSSRNNQKNVENVENDSENAAMRKFQSERARKLLSETSQAECIKRHIPGETFHAKDPQLKSSSECFTAKDLKQKFRSGLSKRNF
jgi:hypothetical protein